MNQIKFSHYLVIGILAGTVMLMQSCLDPKWDFERISDEVVISPGIAAPIAYGTLSLGDMVSEVDKSNYIEKDEEGLLYVTYSDELFSYPANQIFEIPDQTFLEYFFDTEIAFTPTDDTVRFHKDKDGVFVFENNARLDSIHIKAMDLVIDVKSSFKHTGNLTITSESVLVDGQAFKEIVQISDASGNFTETRTIPMDGHSVYLDNSVPGTTTLPLSFDLELVNSGSPVLPGESCDITISFVDPEFNAVFGYFGDYELILSDGDVTLDLFNTDDLNGGSLLFGNPRFNLNISNSYGIPVEIDIHDVSAYSRINDVTTNVIFNPGVNPFFIDAPGMDRIGDTLKTVIDINKDNCNIIQVMETFPNEFDYSVTAITNPNGPETTNFVTDSSNLEIDFEVTLPLYVNAKGFSMEQTEEFDFEDSFGESADIIDYFRLTMDAANGLPMAVDMQLYFQDENYTTIDSMFTNDKFLLPPFLDAQDKVGDPREQTKSVEFTKARLEKIKPTKYLLIKAWVSTPAAEEGRYVKFYDYYNIYFMIKMKADLTINSRDL